MSEISNKINQCFYSIVEWKHHIMRRFCQDSLKYKIIEELQDCEALVIRDWALKFNPLHYRE